MVSTDLSIPSIRTDWIYITVCAALTELGCKTFAEGGGRILAGLELGLVLANEIVMPSL